MKGFSLLQQEELRFETGGIGWNPQASGVSPGVLGNGGSRCHQGGGSRCHQGGGNRCHQGVGSRCHQGLAAYIEPAPQVASPKEGCPPGLSVCTGPSQGPTFKGSPRV